jgi:hypothetical protein
MAAAPPDKRSTDAENRTETRNGKFVGVNQIFN